MLNRIYDYIYSCMKISERCLNKMDITNRLRNADPKFDVKFDRFVDMDIHCLTHGIDSEEILVGTGNLARDADVFSRFLMTQPDLCSLI